jgi:hypothetical protein
MSVDQSARLALPLLTAGQAQKEITHNEALARIDIAVQAVAIGIGDNTAPDAPVAGACWIVGDAPTGAWSGMAGALAGWTGDGWRFVAPSEGMAVWLSGEKVTARYEDGAWRIGDVAGQRLLIDGIPVIGAQAAAIREAIGGTTVDAEAREVLQAILVALRGHGLIAA